jgi:hypothetical protein
VSGSFGAPVTLAAGTPLDQQDLRLTAGAYVLDCFQRVVQYSGTSIAVELGRLPIRICAMTMRSPGTVFSSEELAVELVLPEISSPLSSVRAALAPLLAASVLVRWGGGYAFRGAAVASPFVRHWDIAKLGVGLIPEAMQLVGSEGRVADLPVRPFRLLVCALAARSEPFAGAEVLGAWGRREVRPDQVRAARTGVNTALEQCGSPKHLTRRGDRWRLEDR